eukprot:365105-Chlamydomonas_euryale.AAC.14
MSHEKPILRSPDRLDNGHGLALAVAGVANVVRPFLVCDPVAGKIWKLLLLEKPVLRVKSKEWVSTLKTRLGGKGARGGRGGGHIHTYGPDAVE